MSRAGTIIGAWMMSCMVSTRMMMTRGRTLSYMSWGVMVMRTRARSAIRRRIRTVVMMVSSTMGTRSTAITSSSWTVRISMDFTLLQMNSKRDNPTGALANSTRITVPWRSFPSIVRTASSASSGVSKDKKPNPEGGVASHKSVILPNFSKASVMSFLSKRRRLPRYNLYINL